MTITELAARSAEEILANAENLDGQPMDPVEALARKIAKVADDDGITCQGVNVGKDERFTYEERLLCSPATFERAERYRQEATKATLERAKKKTAPKNDGTHEVKKDAKGRFWVVPKAGGHEHGPFDTKGKAQAKRIEIQSGAFPSEPTPEVPGQPQAETEADNQADQAESEETVKTSKKKSTKKAATKQPKAAKPAKTPKASKPAAHKANGKPKAEKKAKAPKAAKPDGEKKMGALEAAHEVLKGRTVPMSAKALIETMAEKGLWTSPGGKTPDATLSAALNREIDRKGKDSRFCKPEPGKFAAA